MRFILIMMIWSMCACTDYSKGKSAELSANSLNSLKSKPSYILCSVEKDTLAVVRVMYLSKMQQGNYFFEAIPKPLRQAGHSEHFLIGFNRFDEIRLQIPNEPSVYPDCKIGSSLDDLEANGQVGKFVIE